MSAERKGGGAQSGDTIAQVDARHASVQQRQPVTAVGRRAMHDEVAAMPQARRPARRTLEES
jgi:hypothetical protein